MGNALEEKIRKILQTEDTCDPMEPCHWKEDLITQLSQLFKDEMLSIIGEDKELTEEEMDSREGDNGAIDYSVVRKYAINNEKAHQRSTLEERVLRKGGK